MAAWADPLAGVSSSDPFDASQGATISMVTPSPGGPYAADADEVELAIAVITGAGGPEEGVAFLTDTASQADPASFRLTLPAPVCVEAVRVFARHDADPPFYNRSMSAFQVTADPDSSSPSLVLVPIAVPYAGQPGNTSTEPEGLDLIVPLDAPTTASVWQIGALQAVEANSPYNGVRLVEVDAIPCFEPALHTGGPPPVPTGDTAPPAPSPTADTASPSPADPQGGVREATPSSADPGCACAGGGGGGWVAAGAAWLVTRRRRLRQ